jgi:hypothetical protein
VTGLGRLILREHAFNAQFLGRDRLRGTHVRNQFAKCDIVLLSKRNLVADTQLKAARAPIRSVRPEGLPRMNVADFEDLLDRLGDEMSAWPAPLQQSATDLLRSSDQARLLLEEARRLRQTLTAPAVRAPAGLSDRIMLSIPRADPKSDREPAPRHAARPPPSASPRYSALASLFLPRAPGPILAICFLIGIFVGLYPSLLPDQSSHIDFTDFLAYAMDISRVTDH